MNTAYYNDIDLKNTAEFSKIKTDTFWSKDVDIFEQLILRYTKQDDLILFCSNGKNPYPADLTIKLKRNHHEIPDFSDVSFSLAEKNIKQRLNLAGVKKYGLIIANIDISENVRCFDLKFIDNIAKTAKYLGVGRFLALIASDVYFDSECHLYSYKYAEMLQDVGLKLKSPICVESQKEPDTSQLWQHRALESGFNVISHKNIFVFQNLNCDRK